MKDASVNATSSKYQREFFLRYFLRNNVEADVLRVIFFAMIRNEKIDFKELHKYSVFEYVSSNLLKKLRDNRFIAFDGSYDKPTLDGAISCLYILGSIVNQFRERSYSVKDVSKKLYEEGFSFMGIGGDPSAHEKIVKAFIENLTVLGFLTSDGSTYTLADSETIMKIPCGIVKQLIDNDCIKNRQMLGDIIDIVKRSLSLDNFSLGFLIKQSDPSTQQKITSLLGRPTLEEQSILPLIREQIANSTGKDHLASAAYWQLEAALHEERGENKLAEQCVARRCISLAIFCKRNGDHKGAAQHYERAADIMSKHPEYAKNATLQLANAAESKARYLTKERNFQDSSNYYLRAAELFETLGNKKESTFCKFMNLKSQAIEQASYGEYLAASKLMREAGDLIKPYEEKRYFDSIAHAYLMDKDYAYSNNNLDEASSACEEAAKFFQKAENQRLNQRALGAAAQFEGRSLENKKAPYVECAEKFKLAAQYYEKSLDLEASANCYADSCKNYGLDAKNRGQFQEAIKFFTEGKRILRELSYSCEDSETARNYRNGELWFEAMLTETIANQKLLEAIPLKKELADVARLLTHSADLFTRVGDYKHAEINSTFVMVTMAIDAFHKQEYQKATALIQDAKSMLPADFAFSIFEGEVQPGWQPLRSALDTLDIFDKYARQIETEKGFSFESRVRELIRKMHPEYTNIESKVFKPEDEEVGIVFKDNTPIEIDALGNYVRDSDMHILIAEIKNITKLVGTGEMNKFLKKIDFVSSRYSRIARLQSLRKALITCKLFISSSGFEAAAISLAEKNNIQIFDKEGVKELLKKYALYRIP